MRANYDNLLSVTILPEDVDQEAELLKLEGKIPHKGIIAKRLYNAVPDLHFSYWIPQSAKKIETTLQPISSNDYEKLISFLYSTDISFDIVNNFLENPEDETALNILVNALKAGGSISKEQWEDTIPKSKSIRVLLLDCIILNKKIEYIDLVKYISSMHLSKRPAEAVRISLKRLVASNLVKETDGTYTGV